mgnify:CR=1 FL=1
MAPPQAAAAAALWVPAAAFARGLEPYKRLGAVLIREDCASVAVSNPYLNLSSRAGGIMLRQGRVPARALQLLITKAVAPADLGGWVIGAQAQGRDGAPGHSRTIDHVRLTWSIWHEPGVRIFEWRACASTPPPRPGPFAALPASPARFKLCHQCRPERLRRLPHPVTPLAPAHHGGRRLGPPPHIQQRPADPRAPPPPPGCERGTADPEALPPARAQTLRELVAALRSLRGAQGLPLCWHVRDPGEGPSCRIVPGGSGGGAGAGGAAPPAGPAALAECNAGGEFLQSYLDTLGALNTFG